MTELEKLQDWLDKNHIEYIRRKDNFNYGYNQILIETSKVKLSFICQIGSYGFEQGLIEMWDFGDEDPIGFLNAENCKKIIKERV